MPLAVSGQIGVISYSPLGAGLLTGKYRVNKHKMNFVVADRFIAHAAEHSVHPATLAVAWVMSNPAITAPIIAARNVEQLEYSLAAIDVDVTPQWRNEISELSVTPAPATDRGETLLPMWT